MEGVDQELQHSGHSIHFRTVTWVAEAIRLLKKMGGVLETGSLEKSELKLLGFSNERVNKMTLEDLLSFKDKSLNARAKSKRHPRVSSWMRSLLVYKDSERKPCQCI